MIDQCFEDLSHALRIYGEHMFKFHTLALIDKDEAVGNLNQGFSSILNGMHSLYDANKRRGGSDWYAKDEFLFVAALRNARHHNNANKIRQVFDMHWPGDRSGRVLLLVPEPGEEGASCLEYYISLSDLDMLLSQESKVNRLPANAKSRIRDLMRWDLIESIANDNLVPMQRVFYNAIPILIDACVEIFPDIAKEIIGKSTESQIFKAVFETNQKCRMGDILATALGGN